MTATPFWKLLSILAVLAACGGADDVREKRPLEVQSWEARAEAAAARREMREAEARFGDSFLEEVGHSSDFLAAAEGAAVATLQGACRILEGDAPGGEHDVELPRGPFFVHVSPRSSGRVHVKVEDAGGLRGETTQDVMGAAVVIDGPASLRIRITATGTYAVAVHWLDDPRLRD